MKELEQIIHIQKANGINSNLIKKGLQSYFDTPFWMIRNEFRKNEMEMDKVMGFYDGIWLRYELGIDLPSIPLAKHIQEVCHSNGIAVTLDEMFLHVQAKNYDSID